MNDLPRQKLKEIIIQYGRSLCDEPQRCEGLLRDLCGQYQKEIAVLVGALKERVPADLLASQNSTPPVVFLARLTKKLQDNLGLAEEAARWAVESWALALGVISSNDLKTNPSSDPPIPTPVPTPIPTPVPDSAGQPTSSFSVSSTIPVQLPVNPVTIPSQPVPPPTPPSPSNNWTKIAIAISSVGVLALAGSVVHFQEQQKQASDREIAELKAREEQRLEAEQRQREEAERRRKEAEQQLAEEQRRRQEAEARLEAARQKSETFVPSESVNQDINEGEAISLIENLYYALSEKNFDQARSLYSPQLAESFSSPSFFSQFKRVTVEDLQVTSRTDTSINFIGQNTYVYPDGSTQRELRSYTVRNLDGELKITASEFIKVTKFR
ncbi:hypothetical protein PN470_19845 [Microcystis sp. CS-574]|uniref:hypothetical protein n=1 Tax=Microcystis sp. CS-574 TaxID=3021718 RepID=UPI00232F9D13|nr:hypothetical protein [Microcystis sp. CS-574]MDB9406482.1 hypothetical protein [Microcystis sp. CS-574]